MSEHTGERGFRVDFEAELRYSTGGSTDGGGSGSITVMQEGYLEADEAGARQYFDTPSKRLYGKPAYAKSALFDEQLSDVSSLKWNEATGAVHLNTRKRKGIRSLRPLYYNERDEAVAGAERLAMLWFPGAIRVRTEMTAREKRLNGMVNRVFAAVFTLVPLAVITALIVIGAPLAVLLIFGPVAALFLLGSRAMIKLNRAQRTEVVALATSGATWVEASNPAFQP